MSLLTTLIIFNILILIYMIIIEIFTSIYRLNGLSKEKAKFQVISLLTNTGYTTHESEMMLLTKDRRKFTQFVMICSYIYNIAIVSTLINVFATTHSTNIEEIKFGVIITLINLFIIFVLNKSFFLKSKIDALFMKIIDRKKKKDNSIYVYDTYGTKTIAEVVITKLKTKLKNKTIEEIGLGPNYHIQLMVIKRGEEVISTIEPTTIIQENDVIIVFGRLKDIKQLFLKNK